MDNIIQCHNTILKDLKVGHRMYYEEVARFILLKTVV